MGGGVIARDLYETNSRLGDDAKSVLVIEKGPLLFHSHCLNTARPEGLANDRGQQNDTFFARFRQDYKFETADGGNDVYGGPMYNLGGRSATWGLFAPRIHENTLARYFPVAVETALKDTYYEKAEKLFNISLPTTKIIHQHLIDRLNAAAESDHGIHWQWGKIASEFKDDKNFDFAEGAYSTIDRLLEIAMSKPLGPPPEKRPQEHINFKMLIRTEVRKLEINSQKTVTGVVVRTEAGVEHTIKLKANGRVILAAGSVNSPAILFRSNISPRADCLLTDHDVIYRSLAFRYLKENYEKLVGAMKLQTYFNLGLGDNRVGLVDMSIDASSYLPRSNTADYSLPQFIMAFIIPCTLEPSCNVNLGSNNEPTVKIVRNTRYSTTERQKYEERMKKVIESATGVIEKHFKVEFIGKDKPFMNNEYFGKLELCAIASELGTLPMPGRGTEASSVDENLKLKGGYEGIYVCDLSVFPMSPEVNPSLTLAALALRLSRHLVPRRRYRATTTTEICVVNSSGRPIKVWVSNLGGAQRKYLQPEVVLPGGRFATERILNVQESVMVYRLSKADESQYSTEPELYIGHPGGGRKGVITIL
ncbi:hypothetical protein FRB94_013072 [Tulasnella sp. JGI-2019a]|nr:hypothetical protein FRB94_013072 [Tulasnella sp. JGI-2019a]